MTAGLRRLAVARQRARGPWWTLAGRCCADRSATRGPTGASTRVSLVLIALSVALRLLAPWPLAILIDTVLGDKPLPSSCSEGIDGVGPTTLLVFARRRRARWSPRSSTASPSSTTTSTRGSTSGWCSTCAATCSATPQRLSLRFHDRKRTGQLMFQINNQAAAVGAITVALPPLLQSVVTLVGMFVIVSAIEPTLALLSLSVVPFIYGSAGYYARRIQPRLVQRARPRGPVADDRARGDGDAAGDRRLRARGPRVPALPRAGRDGGRRPRRPRPCARRCSRSSSR